MNKKILVTGGAGFIGSALVHYLIERTEHYVVNVDKLSYAGNLESLSSLSGHPRYTFEQLDICNRAGLERVFAQHQPNAVMHLAAETHVDRSIDGPDAFIQSNIMGTFTLLETSRQFWKMLAQDARSAFRFLHVSTDEVYGSLEGSDLFTEKTPFDPRSPYSASKAASDHLASAWFHTYGLPVLITNCSNNYGPFQFPEKLIPVVVMKALAGEKIPVYGTGDSVRNWLYVDDHARALLTVLEGGQLGETYNIGGHNEIRTLDLVETVCDLLDELRPSTKHVPHKSLISFVTDRPGHDMRYAINAKKMQEDLRWVPQETFETGLRKTVAWYLDNQAWCNRVMDGSYKLERLGLT